MIHRRASLSAFRRGGCAKLDGQSVVVPCDWIILSAAKVCLFCNFLATEISSTYGSAPSNQCPLLELGYMSLLMTSVNLERPQIGAPQHHQW